MWRLFPAAVGLADLASKSRRQVMRPTGRLRQSRYRLALAVEGIHPSASDVIGVSPFLSGMAVNDVHAIELSEATFPTSSLPRIVDIVLAYGYRLASSPGSSNVSQSPTTATTSPPNRGHLGFRLFGIDTRPTLPGRLEPATGADNRPCTTGGLRMPDGLGACGDLLLPQGRWSASLLFRHASFFPKCGQESADATSVRRFCPVNCGEALPGTERTLDLSRRGSASGPCERPQPKRGCWTHASSDPASSPATRRAAGSSTSTGLLAQGLTRLLVSARPVAAARLHVNPFRSSRLATPRKGSCACTFGRAHPCKKLFPSR